MTDRQRAEGRVELPPRVDPDRVHRVLLEKARDPRPFVRHRITAVRILAEHPDGFDREVHLFGVPVRERVTVAPRWVRFDRLGPPWDGWFVNAVDGGALRWSFDVANPPEPPGTPPLPDRYRAVMGAVLARASGG